MSTKIKPDNNLFQVNATQLQLGDALVTASDNSITLPIGSNINGLGELSTVHVIADLEDVAITSPTAGQVIKFDGTNWINGTDENSGGGGGGGGGGATALSGLTDVTVTSPSSGQVLKFNGTSWVNGTDENSGGGGATALSGLTDVTVTSPSSGQVLKFNGTSWVNGTDENSGGGGGALSTRTLVTGITPSIGDNATSNITIAGAKAYMVMKVQTSAAAWVRLYSDTASRTADTTRDILTDPAPGSGVLAEFITTGPQTVLVTPAVLGFNAENIPTTDIPVAITNKSGSTTSITVSLVLLQLEG